MAATLVEEPAALAPPASTAVPASPTATMASAALNWTIGLRILAPPSLSPDLSPADRAHRVIRGEPGLAWTVGLWKTARQESTPLRNGPDRDIPGGEKSRRPC